MARPAIFQGVDGLPPLDTQIKQFLAKPWPANQWLDNGKVNVYLRKCSMRALDRTTLGETLDLANVEVREPFRRQGVFTALLDHLESVNPYEYLFVENVVELPGFPLGPMLTKRGYTRSPIGFGDLVPSYYKRTKKG